MNAVQTHRFLPQLSCQTFVQKNQIRSILLVNDSLLEFRFGSEHRSRLSLHIQLLFITLDISCLKSWSKIFTVQNRGPSKRFTFWSSHVIDTYKIGRNSRSIRNVLVMLVDRQSYVFNRADVLRRKENELRMRLFRRSGF